MLTQQCKEKRNFCLAIQRSIENSSLQSNSTMSKLPIPIADVNSSRPHHMKAFDFGDKDCASNSGFKITRKTGIPVLTSLRGLQAKQATYVRDLAEIPLDEDARPKLDKKERPDSEPVVSLHRKVCTEFISEVEQILSHTLLKGVAFGSMLEASRKKPATLEDELSDIMDDLGHPNEIIAEIPSTPPEYSEAPACPLFVPPKSEQDASPENSGKPEFDNVIQPSAFCGLVHRRNSDKSSRQSSRSRSRQSRSRRSRRSRRQYVIPANGCYKCSPTAICVQPKPCPDVHANPKPDPNPTLDFKMLKGNFNFGTEELEKLNSVFIQRSDRFCSHLCNFLQDTFPGLYKQQDFDVFRDEISIPTFNVTKTRNPLSCLFADCEDLKFALHLNEIPRRQGIPTTSILIECKECPASNCPFHKASIYICNGTMEMGTYEHLSCNKLDPLILLKNTLMKETMVIRTRSFVKGWEDADFLVYKLDEESNDPYDEKRDGPLIGHIARRLPKEVSPGTFNRTPIIFPETERLSIIFHDKLNAFSKGIILGAALLLKHEVLS